MLAVVAAIALRVSSARRGEYGFWEVVSVVSVVDVV
jgi:hypothetical protein